MPSTGTKWITIPEAARMLGISPLQMRQIVNRRSITVRRIPNTRPLVLRSDVEAMAANAIQQPATAGVGA